MDQILGNLPNCFVYLDNVLISSTDLKSHLHHVHQVLNLLCLHSLSINPDKCVFGATELDYLGIRVSGSGCVSLFKYAEIISAFPCSVDKKSLQRFLGILNFYSRFLKGAPGLLFPLTEALKGKDQALSWMNQAFAAPKSILSEVPTPVHQDPTARISLSINSAWSQVGAVLQQEVAGSWAPLAFFSKRLSPAESRYLAFGRELFAEYSALHNFWFLLKIKQFVLFSDPKPLRQALFKTFTPWSTMQQWHLSFISEFKCYIHHLPGAENLVADALSCPGSIDPIPQLVSIVSQPSLLCQFFM